MKVAEVTAFGPPEVLEPAERLDPEPAEGEVVVRIHAAAVNPTDLAARSIGRAYIPQLELPFIPGWDLAGVVEKVGAAVADGSGEAAREGAGEGVIRYEPGDRVCGMIPFGRIGGRIGSYAEAAAVDPAWLAPLSEEIGFEEGATLPLNSLTAHQALAFFDLEPGARILITGASGGVGGYATSLALRRGLHVIAVAGRDDEEWVRRLGAHEVLPRDADLGAIETVDGVLDAVPVGPERATAALREGGTAVFTRPPQPAASERFRFETVMVQPDPATLTEMAQLLAEGVLRTRVARTFPLEEAAEAHRVAEAGGLKGKVVLRM